MKLYIKASEEEYFKYLKDNIVISDIEFGFIRGIAYIGINSSNITRVIDVYESIFEIKDKVYLLNSNDFEIKYKNDYRDLTSIQRGVIFDNKTEAPFTNEYHNTEEKGIYIDILTKQPLFSSKDKFQSGCGWPSFSKPIDDRLLMNKLDVSHGMVREEIRTNNSDIHLGHVFEDGPIISGGLRYCINSAALRFIPLDEMEVEGYGEYLDLVK